jgi:hypothetical protein
MAKKKDFFKIVRTGFDKTIDREEIEINAGKNGHIFIYKTDEGIVIDVYDGDENCIDSLAIFDDELT